VETVLIPGPGRSTVCVSSQSGCTRHCQFCATATLGFTRPLAAGEIVLQYLVARAAAPREDPARNVVFMGMGEPMDNLDAVLAAVNRLTDEGAPRLSAANVTVSTSGVVPGMERFLRECPAHLALSLNATTDAQRERLMPHNKVWPIAALLDTLRVDHGRGSGRRYFIEYVLWEGVNDSDADSTGGSTHRVARSPEPDPAQCVRGQSSPPAHRRAGTGVPASRPRGRRAVPRSPATWQGDRRGLWAACC